MHIRIFSIDQMNKIKKIVKSINLIDNNQEAIACKKNIEDLRLRMEGSKTTIAVVDYGAVSPLLDNSIGNSDDYRVTFKTIGDICKRASAKRERDMILYNLIRCMKPKICLELGTCLGISACYQGLALKFNQSGTLVTLEGSKILASIAIDNVKSLGLDNVTVLVGKFYETMPQALLHYNPVDFAFIDGHHEENATIKYWQMLLPFLSDNAVIVFDDIRWSSGMTRAWKHIKKNKKIDSALVAKGMGICLLK